MSTFDTCGTCAYFDTSVRRNCSAPIPMAVESIIEHAVDSDYTVTERTEAYGCDCYAEKIDDTEHVCGNTCVTFHRRARL